MSNIDHTPGPWSWDGNPCDYDPLQEAPWLIGENGTAVIKGEITVENPRDRDLLAASRDMFDALQSALKTVEFERHPFRPWHDKARAAIAKARGESS